MTGIVKRDNLGRLMAMSGSVKVSIGAVQNRKLMAQQDSVK
jgi:hypothetical protein